MELLTAAGATSNTSITEAGVNYDYELGQGKAVIIGKEVTATLYLEANCSFSVDIEASQAVIVTLHE